jgi:hypothetical protein
MLVKMYSWVAFLLIGIIVGLSAFVIDLLVEYLVTLKW